MKYKALVSFSGAVTMFKDETKEITDEAVVKDLLNAGYIMPLTKIVRGKPATKSKKGGSKKCT